MKETPPVAAQPVVRPLVNNPTKKNLKTLGVSVAVVLGGIVVGWLLSGGMTGSTESSGEVSPGIVNTQKEAGIKDESLFKTVTEGVLREGGKNGEGTHFLERSGGESQNAYLVSSTLDLSTFVGKKVQIWGNTVSGQSAGWLIDVGKIKQID